jgi:DNA-binding IclR family transcriptional regulator
MPRAVVRAMQILEFLAPCEDGLTHAQLTKALNIPKSSMSAILGELVSLHCISFDQSTKRYVLGPKIVSLAHSYLEGLDLIKIGVPIVKGLAKITGETVAIYIQSATESQLIYKEDGPQSIALFLKVGARAPMYAIAAGKVLLAHLPEREIDLYLSSTELKPFTPYTITEPEKLRGELQKIREGEFAYNHEEFEEGVIAVATPVYDRFGTVVAALCVVAPSFRINKERREFIENVLREKAAEFSHHLGFAKHFEKTSVAGSDH